MITLPRKEFLEVLETTKPALSTKELIEELLHFWSDGKFITAYNDQSLGIQVPFESEFKGGIRGTIILGMLEHSRAKQIEMEIPEEGEATIKCGRARIKLPLLPPERAIFELPDFKKLKPYSITTSFLQ